MKRRIWALLFCALLTVQLLLPPAGAAERVYFTAIGNYILPLSDSTMPVWSGGYLYIAGSVFTGAGRESLGISQVLNTGQERLVLYSGGRSLTFDLAKGTARDNDGQSYSPGAIRRGGAVFVPVYAVTRCFELVYSIIEVDRGSLVWIRPSGSSLSDSLFADAAKHSMESVYADYLRAKEQTDAPAGTVDKPTAPAAPSAESSPEEPETELHGKSVYLCLEGVSSAMLDVLDVYGAQAAFFLSPEQIAEEGDLLRRMIATGQSVGILADGADPERSVAEQLEAGNRALAQATCGKTRLALIRNGGSQAAALAEELGFRCLRPDLDRSGQPLRNAAAAESLLQRTSARRGDVSIWLGDGAASVGLRSFLLAVREAGGVCVALTEAAA